MTTGTDNKSFTELFRWITPIMITIGIFILSGIDTKVNSIDDKLFKHLTNDDIHTPKNIVVNRPEFLIYQEMRSKEMAQLRDGICEIKSLIEKRR